MEGLLNSLKGFLLPKLISWIAILIGGYFTTQGITASETSITEVVGGIVTLLVGLLVELFTHKKALNTIPPVI